MTVEEPQLGVASEVRHVREIRVVVATIEEPADVSMPEALLDRRVRVIRSVGVLVVSPVPARPPERSVLHRRCAQQREEELKWPAGLVRAVREVTVVAGGDGPHANGVANRRERDELPGEGNEERQCTGQMNEHRQNSRQLRHRSLTERTRFCHGRFNLHALRCK